MLARKENGIYVVDDSFEISYSDFEGTATQVKANMDLVVEKALGMGMVGDGRFNVDLEYPWNEPKIVVSYNFTRTEKEKERTLREQIEAKLKEEKSTARKIASAKKKLKSDADYNEFLRLKEKFKGL